MKNIEAEGGELILRNSSNDYVIIPKKDRKLIKNLIEANKGEEIDEYVDGLPVSSDYAEDGTLLSMGTMTDAIERERYISYLNEKYNVESSDNTSEGSSSNYVKQPIAKPVDSSPSLDTPTPEFQSTLKSKIQQKVTPKYTTDRNLNKPDTSKVADNINYVEQLEEEFDLNILDEVSKQKNLKLNRVSQDIVATISDNKKKSIKGESDKYYKKYTAENKAPVKKMQQEFLDKGLFDDQIKESDYNTKDKAVKLQEKLKDAGYEMPVTFKSGKADGIVGKETATAIKEYNSKMADGYFGDKTLSAFNKNIGYSDFAEERGKNSCDASFCAEYVTSVYDRVMNKSKQLGVIGDAWTMIGNIKDEGGTELYNIYNDEEFKGKLDKATLLDLTERKIKENKLDVSILKKGDVVGIYGRGSRYHEQALKEGTTYNTHVGIVSDIVDGEPIITSNYFGELRHRKASQMQITAVARPKDTESTVPAKLEAKEVMPLTLQDDNKVAKDFSKELTQIIPSLVDDTSSTIDKKWLLETSLAITQPETGYFTNIPDKTKVLKTKAARTVKGLSSDDKYISHGLTKIKLANFSEYEKNYLGITSHEDLYDVSKAAKATAYILNKNYIYFTRYSEANKDLKITEEEIRELTILAYNQGIYGNLARFGFDNKGKVKDTAKEKLSTVGKNTKVKDVSSTNFKYLPIIGDMLYNLRYPEGHPSYISRVEDRRTKLKFE